MTQEIASKLAVHAQGGSIHAKDLIDPLQSFADQMILPYNGKSLIHASQKVRSYATQARRGQRSPVDQYEMHIFLVQMLLESAYKCRVLTPEFMVERICKRNGMSEKTRTAAFEVLKIINGNEALRMKKPGTKAAATTYIADKMTGRHHTQKECAE